ncbi:7 transmembrane receptor [Necator americanus]|uniref:7 transmembrane receptor n=1 Tax=Necator americanus TaxID=51031 RepID=W2SM72_NECAM|nr:7 transmembrane receptor [Necator americanus]ETN70643.1 7 transmembrane receptor [Necator americanus]
MVVTASAYTLAVIAFERYYAICRPLHSRIWQTRSHAYAMIMLVWVIALAANVLMLFMYEERTYNGNGLTCTPIYKPVYHFANQVYMTIVLLAVPLVIMTVLYGSVIRTLKIGIRQEIAAVDSVDQESKRSDSSEENNELERKRSLFRKLTAKWRTGKKDRSGEIQCLILIYRLSPFPSFRDSSARKKSDIPPLEASLRSTHIQKSAVAKQRVIRMLIVVVIIFFCCWTPSYIWWLLLMAGDSFELGKDENKSECISEFEYIIGYGLLIDIDFSFQSLELSVWNSDLNTFITLLTYISSCTNPITYCFLNKKFRTAIYAMFGRKKALRHHFQKVYFPVNAHTPHKPHEKLLINRSVSSTFNPQHPVDFKPPQMTRSISQAKSKKNATGSFFFEILQMGHYTMANEL